MSRDSEDIEPKHPIPVVSKTSLQAGNAITEKLGLSTDPVSVYIRGLNSPRSQATQLSVIRKVIKSLGFNAGSREDYIQLPWSEILDKTVVEAFIALANNQGYSKSYQNNMLAAFRGMAKEAEEYEYIGSKQARSLQRIKYKTIEPIIGRPIVTPEDIGDLVGHCINLKGAAAIRDATIIAMAFGTGLRVSELASLTLEDFDNDYRDLKYIGKGNVTSSKPVAESARDILKLWLSVRETDDRLPSTKGPLFIHIDRHGKFHPLDQNLNLKGISAVAIYQSVIRRSTEFSPQALRPHDFRRGVITWLLDVGNDPSKVAIWSGHKSVKTLIENYDLNITKRKRELADQIVF